MDVSTFQLLAYSVQPLVQIIENAVRFNFPNINLPDSNVNEPASHGYVQYKIKLKDNLRLGAQITNTAYIYFDFNAPVITNTTTNTLPCGAPDSVSVSESICNGDIFYFGNNALTAAGNYIDTLQNINGCDSVVHLTLTVHSTLSTFINRSACANEPYNFNGVILNASGVYYDTLSNVNGCDSVVALTLTVLQTSDTTISASTCANLPYNFNGAILTASGIYYDTLQNVNGCDSIIQLSLNVIDTSAAFIQPSICAGDTFYFHNKIFTEAGNYIDTLQNTNGCDSFVYLTLNMYPVIDPLIVSQTICAGDSFYFNNRYVDTAGVYNATFASILGCDSPVTLHLTVLPPAFTAIGDAFCENHPYNFNGALLTDAGLYYDTLSSSTGCDSVVSLTLYILWAEHTTVDTVVVSGSVYTLPSGNVVSAAGTYVDTLQGANGCDSIVTTTLAVISGIPPLSKKELGVRLFPNPASNEVTIVIDNLKDKTVLSMKNVLGQTLLTKEISSSTTTLDLSSFASGVYIIELNSAGMKAAKRLVKE